MTGRCVYLDHNASTPVRPEVLEAMLPYLREHFANPNSVHSLGQRARAGVERARASVAALLNAASPDEIVFTSCGSESDALAVLGAGFKARAAGRDHLVLSAVEHEAVQGNARRLEGLGFRTTTVGVDPAGRVDPEAVAEAIGPRTFLVSLMLANNEVGALQPVREAARLCRERGVLCHTDAVQGVGKVPVDVAELGVDLLAMSGHKLNAPKGVGALYIRRGTPLESVVAGRQEKNRRGGTENVAAIVALGRACELAARELPDVPGRLGGLRDRLEAGALKVPGSHRTSRARERLPNTAHLCFEGVDGHQLVAALDLKGICVSSGPACVGGTALSHVLAAMQVPAELGRGALRVSMGWGTSAADVDAFLEALPGAVERLRAAAPMALGGGTSSP